MYSIQRTRIMARVPTWVIAAAMFGAMGGCATASNGNPDDPLEGFNRATFRFNDALDRKVATPLAKGYNKVVPERIRTMVANFFSNIGDVTVMANNFAQGRILDGSQDVVRILANSIFGLGGLFDVATPAGLPKHNQDFGLTLGHWGLPSGPYVVLPVFGPSTFRDTAGLVSDWQINPVGYLDPAERNSLTGVNFVSTRARYLGATDLLSTAALDKYSFTRDAYLGRRRYLLNTGQEESLPDYEKESAPSEAPAKVPQGSTPVPPSGVTTGQ
jgi:phospholipid-binding lipoprotein MlaA